MQDYTAFSDQYNDGTSRKTFTLNNAVFTNKYGQRQQGWFQFDY